MKGGAGGRGRAVVFRKPNRGSPSKKQALLTSEFVETCQVPEHAREEGLGWATRKDWDATGVMNGVSAWRGTFFGRNGRDSRTRRSRSPSRCECQTT